MAVWGLCCCAGFSLVTEKGGYSPAAVHGLLTAAASLLWRAGFCTCGTWAQKLQLLGSVVCVLSSEAQGLSCPTAYGIFLDQGWNACSLHWQVDSLPLSHQGSLEVRLLISEPQKEITSSWMMMDILLAFISLILIFVIC